MDRRALAIWVLGAASGLIVALAMLAGDGLLTDPAKFRYPTEYILAFYLVSAAVWACGLVLESVRGQNRFWMSIWMTLIPVPLLLLLSPFDRAALPGLLAVPLVAATFLAAAVPRMRRPHVALVLGAIGVLTAGFFLLVVGGVIVGKGFSAPDSGLLPPTFGASALGLGFSGVALLSGASRLPRFNKRLSLELLRGSALLMSATSALAFLAVSSLYATWFITEECATRARPNELGITGVSLAVAIPAIASLILALTYLGARPAPSSDVREAEGFAG